MEIRHKLAQAIHDALGLSGHGMSVEAIADAIEIPKNKELGDFAFPCFMLAKAFKKSPVDIAQESVSKIRAEFIKDHYAVGAYINFFIKAQETGSVVTKILEEREHFGKKHEKHPERILIESPGPNTNKPLHIGHLRNILLGSSVINILRSIGHEVISVNINNDRGIHICKSMLAYKKFGEGKEPDKKTDHFVGDWYVLFAHKAAEDPKLEEEAQQMLVKWEQGDKHVRALWKKMNDWAYKGFKETYKRLGFHVQKEYYESETYEHGKDIVLDGVEKDVFSKEEDGRIVVDLEKYGLGTKTLLRADGTTVYMTQDIALAYMRNADYSPDRMVYVVASEQNLHFQQLFKILELLGLSFAKKCYHLSYGMIRLPEGKMKSREGTVVDTDNLIDEMVQDARQEILARDASLSKEELEQRANIIALGAIKFFILKYDPTKDFLFDKRKSLEFEGATGAYVQYAYVRANSILEKEPMQHEHVDVSVLVHEKERHLINLLNQYPQVVQDAARQYKPSLITNYLLDLSQLFSNFYNEVPVIKEPDDAKRNTRKALVKAVSIVIRNGMKLLGIDIPERM